MIVPITLCDSSGLMGKPKGAYWKTGYRARVRALKAGESFIVQTEKEMHGIVGGLGRSPDNLAVTVRKLPACGGWEIIRLKRRPMRVCPNCGFKEIELK